eukprot:Hpha_TRINITY_DN20514_c0_g1::TRINITY_DN20514_c0_g1_i1::g.30672::m.30672
MKTLELTLNGKTFTLGNIPPSSTSALPEVCGTDFADNPLNRGGSVSALTQYRIGVAQGGGGRVVKSEGNIFTFTLERSVVELMPGNVSALCASGYYECGTGRPGALVWQEGGWATPPECWWWDRMQELWLEEGCLAYSLNSTTVRCECTHLTDFGLGVMR